MSLLHKAITLSGACAIGLTLAFAAPAAAEDTKPINFRAVGGAVLGGTWNVGLTGVGKLVNDRYPEAEPGRAAATPTLEGFARGIAGRGMDRFAVPGPLLEVDATDFAREDLEAIVRWLASVGMDM